MAVGAVPDRDALIPASSQTVGVAVGWSFVMNSARLASTIGTAFILARLLGPEAFGTVALALLFVTLVQILIQQGMVPAIVQRPGLTWRHLDSAFWLTLVVSLGLTALCVAVAPFWAGVNGVPEATEVIWALASVILVKGLVVVHEGLLQRQLRFRELAIRTTIASVAGAVVGVAWALARPSVWALVGQQLVAAGVGAIVIWGVTTWRPSRRFRADDANDLLGFATKSTVSSFGVFVNTRVDALLIGVFFGATAVGLYQLAYRLVQSAVEATVYPIAGVALADLARQQGDSDRLAARYGDLVALCTVVGAPVMAAIFASAHPLMRLLGPEWEPAAPALQLLCIVGVVTVIGMVSSPALQAVGRPGTQAGLVWFAAAVSAATFTVTGIVLSGESLDTQVVGMAASRAVVYVAVLLPISQFVLIARHIGFGPSRFVRAAGPPIAASASAAMCGLAIQAVPLVRDAPNVMQVGVAALVTLGSAVPMLLLSTPMAAFVAARVLGFVGRRSKRGVPSGSPIGTSGGPTRGGNP